MRLGRRCGGLRRRRERAESCSRGSGVSGHGGSAGSGGSGHGSSGGSGGRVTRTTLGVTDVGVTVTVAGHAAGEGASVGRLVTEAGLAGLAELADVAETQRHRQRQRRGRYNVRSTEHRRETWLFRGKCLQAIYLYKPSLSNDILSLEKCA